MLFTRTALTLLPALLSFTSPPASHADVPPPFNLYLPLIIQSCDPQLNFIIDSNVPLTETQTIKAGLCDVQANLQKNYGGDISPADKSIDSVRVVATGGSGGCCWEGFNRPGEQIHLDVTDQSWLSHRTYTGLWSAETNTRLMPTHEYTHAWQAQLGCMYVVPGLGSWLVEGIAEYVAYDTYIRLGEITSADARFIATNGAYYTGESNYSLQSLEYPTTSIWPGHIGHVAVEKLVMDSPSGAMSITNLCQQIGSGSPVGVAFQSAFGISKADFYAAFPAYFGSLPH